MCEKSGLECCSQKTRINDCTEKTVSANTELQVQQTCKWRIKHAHRTTSTHSQPPSHTMLTKNHGAGRVKVLHNTHASQVEHRTSKSASERGMAVAVVGDHVRSWWRQALVCYQTYCLSDKTYKCGTVDGDAVIPENSATCHSNRTTE